MLQILIELFMTFLKIGSFSIGGGYAIIPLIQEQVVSSLNWLTVREYTDIITISQMTPGPLVVNTASFVGLRIAGVLGGVLATTGSVGAGCFISVGLYSFFTKNRGLGAAEGILKGLRSSSLGLIAAAAGALLVIAFFGSEIPKLDNFQMPAALVFALSLFLLRKFKLNPIIIIVLSGIAGILLYR